ncbi:autotransporter domain-containing protein [Rhizobium sp. C4]|nr:autotransporter domain-containing protein [Rhizobium sp. C4]
MFTVTGASLNNSGSVTGGAGGASAAGAGVGGVGISGSGLTIINSGTIAGGLSGNGVTRANSITFTAGSNTITFSNATSGLTGAIGLSTNTTTLTFNQTVDTVLNQAITGAGAIAKAGTGKLTLTATNTYTGATTVSAGTLQVGNGGTTGALGNGNIVDNAALVFNRSDAITIANAISGTGSLTQSGTDTLTLTGALTYTGTTTVSGGSIILGDANNAVTLPGNASVTGGNLAVANGSLGSGTITVANGRSVIVGSVGGLTATAGSATITDDGTITFQNASSAGTATINATGVVDFADTATAANSTINLTGGGVGQLRGTSTGGGATFTVGAGSSLSVGNDASLGTARVILNAGTLNISTHNAGNVVAGSIEGNGDIGLGANTLQAGGNNRSTTYSGVMSGTGGFTKQGTGDLKFTGTNSYTGNTNVNGGILSVNGSIAASAGVTVNNGGTLGGNGTVSTTVVNNGGTIAPGNSIGTLTVNGNVTFNNGSTYSVEVNSAGAADKLVVNGTITINPGATLAVKPFNVGETGVTYGTTTNYTIMTSTGALTGTFSNVTDTFAFLDATVAYGANNVVLTLKRNDTSFASVANTPNQRAAAAGVNSLGAGNTIYGAILGLSAPDARAAFDLLSGEIHASVETAIVEDSRFARDAVNSRLVALRRGAANASGHVWIQGFGAYGTWASDGNAAAASRSTGGFFIGSDGEAFDNVSAGVFAGYSRTGIDASARSSSACIDTFQLGAYGGTSLGDLAIRFGGAYSFHDIGTSRSVVFTGLNNTLSSRYQAGTGQLFGEMSYDFKLANGATITPFANLAYVRLDARGFTETGGAAALSSGKDQANTLFSTIGVSGRTTIETGTLPVEIAGKVG